MPGLKLGKEAQAKYDQANREPDQQGWLEKKRCKTKKLEQEMVRDER